MPTNSANSNPKPGARRISGFTNISVRRRRKAASPLADLEPLYQAVAHGCLAALQQEACDKVYLDRILRGTGNDGFYSTKKLSAFGSNLGAGRCFFETPWSRVSPALTEDYQASLLNDAAFNLRALGRLRPNPSNRCGRRWK
ncbi:MAG: hypothetical protein U0Y68_08835 [Blastocatellia bacterium]